MRRRQLIEPGYNELHPNLSERQKNMASRTFSDANLLREGAEYHEDGLLQVGEHSSLDTGAYSTSKEKTRQGWEVVQKLKTLMKNEYGVEPVIQESKGNYYITWSKDHRRAILVTIAGIGETALVQFWDQTGAINDRPNPHSSDMKMITEVGRPNFEEKLRQMVVLLEPTK